MVIRAFPTNYGWAVLCGNEFILFSTEEEAREFIESIEKPDK